MAILQFLSHWEPTPEEPTRDRSARLQENAVDAGKQLIDAQWFMEEKISLAYARREYGVAIDERTWKVVPEETARA